MDFEGSETHNHQTQAFAKAREAMKVLARAVDAMEKAGDAFRREFPGKKSAHRQWARELCQMIAQLRDRTGYYGSLKEEEVPPPPPEREWVDEMEKADKEEG